MGNGGGLRWLRICKGARLMIASTSRSTRFMRSVARNSSISRKSPERWLQNLSRRPSIFSSKESEGRELWPQTEYDSRAISRATSFACLLESDLTSVVATREEIRVKRPSHVSGSEGGL